MSAVAEVDVVFLYVEVRKFRPSSGLGLYVLTMTIILLGIGVGAVRGYRALNRLRSLPDAGEKIVRTFSTLMTAMAGVGCIAIIVSVTYLTELLSQK